MACSTPALRLQGMKPCLHVSKAGARRRHHLIVLGRELVQLKLPRIEKSQRVDDPGSWRSLAIGREVQARA
jgi:hypothetical protein